MPMDPIYGPAFDAELNDLINVSPDKNVYSTIQAIVESADQNTTPSTMLRSDATLFLVLNMGAMIVIPWQKAKKMDFFKQYRSLLEEDAKDILTEAKQMASQQGLKEISSNLLVSVTATRRGGMRTRGINIWGP
jgi:hypothetical protein